jgi:uncharacterized protein (TIGR03435 family)
MKLIRFACAILTIFCAVLCSSLFAQTPAKPAFEVASIKPLPSMLTMNEEIQSGKRSMASIKATMDGARVDLGAVLMIELITKAYSVRPYQIAGPDWVYSQLFEIHAKLPEGASKEQVPEMLQTLLAERFKLVAHRENKEQPVYALIVSKNGPKLKEAAADAVAPAAAADPAKTPSSKSSSDKGALPTNTPEGEPTIKQEGR